MILYFSEIKEKDYLKTKLMGTNDSSLLNLFVFKAVFCSLLYLLSQTYEVEGSKNIIDDRYTEVDHKIFSCYKENALTRDPICQARELQTYSYQERENDPYIKILDVLDYIDISNLETAANCIATFRSDRHLNNRYFNGDPMSQNDVVWLTGYFEDMMPDLLDYLYQEVSRALEGRRLLSKGLHPRQLGVRTAEFIT